MTGIWTEFSNFSFKVANHYNLSQYRSYVLWYLLLQENSSVAEKKTTDLTFGTKQWPRYFGVLTWRLTQRHNQNGLQQNDDHICLNNSFNHIQCSENVEIKADTIPIIRILATILKGIT